MKAWEEIVAATQEGAKTLNDKVINDAHTNAEALFDVAHKLARAKTMPEAMQAQSAFVQRQLKAANTQSKELFELSTQLAQQTFENVNAMLARSLEPLKKVG